MKLSIIIPVYRTQNTLDRCLKSVLSQSFTDYEIILVDDESPDNCPLLCDQYAQQHQQIKVIHKKNGGLSDARNVGIQQATGEYVTFIDSDDAIQEKTLELLMNELNSFPYVDILEYPILERIGNPHQEHLLSFQPKEYRNPMDYWFFEQAYLHTYACNKIFRRKLFLQVFFPKGKTFEDVATIPYLLGLLPVDIHHQNHLSPIIRVTNVGLYLYYWNTNSITVQLGYKDMSYLYEGHIRTLSKIFEKIGDNTALIKKYNISLQNFMAKILNYMLYMNNSSGYYIKHPILVEYTHIVSKTNHIYPFKLRLLNNLGYYRLCKLNRLIHKIYRRH